MCNLNERRKVDIGYHRFLTTCPEHVQYVPVYIYIYVQKKKISTYPHPQSRLVLKPRHLSSIMPSAPQPPNNFPPSPNSLRMFPMIILLFDIMFLNDTQKHLIERGLTDGIKLHTQTCLALLEFLE